MSKSFDTLESKKIVGIEVRTQNEEGKYDVDIPKHWNRFFQEGISSLVPNKGSEKVYALYNKYEGDHTKPYSLVIGHEVTEAPESLPEPLVSVDVPKASYACYSLDGKYPDSLIAGWKGIWSDSQLNRVYSADFEIYDENFDFLSGEASGASIWIGVHSTN